MQLSFLKSKILCFDNDVKINYFPSTHFNILVWHRKNHNKIKIDFLPIPKVILEPIHNLFAFRKQKRK